jgi:hypothetical protein
MLKVLNEPLHASYLPQNVFIERGGAAAVLLALKLLFMRLQLIEKLLVLYLQSPHQFILLFTALLHLCNLLLSCLLI